MDDETLKMFYAGYFGKGDENKLVTVVCKDCKKKFTATKGSWANYYKLCSVCKRRRDKEK